MDFFPDTTFEVAAIRQKFETDNFRFHAGCRQIVLLNTYIEALQTRYERANKNGHKSLRYTLRLRLAVYEGLRHVLYQWASKKADNLDALEQELREASHAAT